MGRKILLLFLILCNFLLNACLYSAIDKQKVVMPSKDINKYDTATFAGGCFWCIEAIFSELKGVKDVKSGYIGGTTKNPTYNEVCTGKSGHAEAVQIIFDNSAISYENLLEIFWQVHDPTTLNKQGADEGTQYRSAIFYHNENQKNIAENFKNKLVENKIFDDEIITEITKATNFYVAENYHQNYYLLNNFKPYCSIVIKPKLDKFKKQFKEKLK